jgi:O-antigen ligase
VIRHYPLGAGWGAAFFRTPNGLTPGTTNVDWPWYHDDYLQLATEVGIPGLAVFLWLWLVLLRRGLRAYYRSRDTLQGALIVGLIASLFAMLVQAATDQIFWHADVGPHIWIIAGLLLAAATLVEQNPVEPQLVA